MYLILSFLIACVAVDSAGYFKTDLIVGDWIGYVLILLVTLILWIASLYVRLRK